MASSFLIIHTSPRRSYVISQALKKISDMRESLIPEFLHDCGFYLTCDRHIVEDEDVVEEGMVYHCIPTLPGGKGGFGSMLRAIGAQIEKTTSREACRDLSGRRMRDVNNEKKLKEWLSKGADREREKEEKRQERLARRRAGVKHNFDDPSYVEQRSKVADDLEDALKTGLQRGEKAGPSATVTSSDIRGKRKTESKPYGKAKRQKEWLGIDIDPDDLSSEDSDEDSHSSGNADKQRGSSQDNSESEETGDSNQAIDLTHKQDNTKTELECEASTSSNNDDSVAAACEAGTSSDSHSSQAPGSKHSDTDQGETTPAEKKPNTLLSLLPPPKNTADNTTQLREARKLEDVDLSNFSSASELEELGLEQLKFALTERGLKCGGTLQQRAERLFSVKGLTRDQIDPSLFPKATNGKGKK